MKNLLIVLLVCCSLASAGQRRDFNIGDTLQCGIVFHIQQDSGRQRILIASMRDQATSIAWYNGQFTATFATTDALFNRANAEKIINTLGTGDYAASLCKNFSLNDSTCPTRDTLWYLPSVAELKLMYQVLDLNGRLPFAKEGYWSSVEFSDETSARKRNQKKANIVDFFNGSSMPVNKSNKYHVRAIREFIN